MADSMRLDLDGFDDLVKKLGASPTWLSVMADDTVGPVLNWGRKEEQKASSGLRMGLAQRKGEDGYRIRSAWDNRVGWVSTTRKAAKGGTGFRMASYSYEVGRKAKNRSKASYTSQLAALWSKPTRPYRADSPLVGTEGHVGHWAQGQVRPVKYRWSTTINIMRNEIPAAIARVESNWNPNTGVYRNPHARNREVQ